MPNLKCGDNADLDGEKTERLRQNGYDRTDKPPDSCHVTKWTYCTLIASIFLNLFDVTLDIYVAYSYFQKKRYSHFAWSVAFILLPSIILSLISIRMYVEDINKGRGKYKPLLWRIVLCVVGIPLQSAPLIRNCDTFYYAVKASLSERQNDERQEEYFSKMLYEDSDTAFLKVFEAYLESAPQVVLQATLLLVDYISGSTVDLVRQCLSILAGFLSMAYSMANYNKCIRREQKDKQNPSFSAFTVHFLWHFTFTVSRILAILTLAVLNSFWTCIATVIHWCGMTVWLAVLNKTTFCGSNNKMYEVFFSCAVGAVYIFNFVNVVDGPTKKQYLFFFLLFFLENTTIAVIWGIESIVKDLHIYYTLLILPTVCFMLSIVFMIVYYKFLHPNRVSAQ